MRLSSILRAGGTTLKDYAHLLSADAELAQTGEKITSLAMDITEFLAAHADCQLCRKGLSVAIILPASPAWAKSDKHAQKLAGKCRL